MLKQQKPLAEPSTADKELRVYTSVLQGNFEQIFEKAHEHAIKTAAPAAEAGSVGDIALVETATEKYVAVKFASGWFRTVALTAV